MVGSHVSISLSGTEGFFQCPLVVEPVCSLTYVALATACISHDGDVTEYCF